MSKKIDFLSYLKQARRDRTIEVEEMKTKNIKGMALFIKFCEELNGTSKKFNFSLATNTSDSSNPKINITHCDNDRLTKIEAAPYDDGIITMISGQRIGSLATTINDAFRHIAEKIAESELPDPV